MLLSYKYVLDCTTLADQLWVASFWYKTTPTGASRCHRGRGKLKGLWWIICITDRRCNEDLRGILAVFVLFQFSIIPQPSAPNVGAVPLSAHARKKASKHWKKGPPANWLCELCHLKSITTDCWQTAGSLRKAESGGKSQSVQNACLRGELRLPSDGKGIQGNWRKNEKKEMVTRPCGSHVPNEALFCVLFSCNFFLEQIDISVRDVLLHNYFSIY